MLYYYFNLGKYRVEKNYISKKKKTDLTVFFICSFFFILQYEIIEQLKIYCNMKKYFKKDLTNILQCDIMLLSKGTRNKFERGKIMNRENLMSEFREGIKCQICGEKITREDFYYDNVTKADGGCKGSVIYGHTSCCEKRNYSYKNLVKNRKQTYSGFCWGSEFETNTVTTNEQRLQLYSWYKLIYTHDCTVAEEFKSGINQGLHGTKKYLEGIENIIDIANGDNCGTHANVSLASWQNNGNAMSWVYDYSKTLFKPLAQAIANLTEEKRIEIFGRDFGSYRHYAEECFEHGDWLAIKNNCLEFRISRYRNATQYTHLLMLYKEFCLVIDKIFLANPNYLTATQTANKMVDLLNKHAQGKAKYQRAERNK